jgi:nucleoside-diphosphate kinase
MSTLTFGIIKPDAVRAGNQGKIVDRILASGFRIRGMKLIHQTRKQAKAFMPFMRAKDFSMS